MARLLIFAAILMSGQETYMYRCLTLAKMGMGRVAPNPMVGAVLVHADRVIGEGYHERYGEAHAEVNCIASVKPADRQLIPQSTLYVSLEPCSHYGKTPPCADLIIREKIPVVKIGMEDPFPKVSGSGIGRLKSHGCEVETGILEKECRELNKRFIQFHTRRRPYVILKWAETGNGMIGTGTEERLHISNSLVNRLVHRWRSEEQAILVGSQTALLDNPSLTTRLWKGKNPLRILIDRNLRVPADAAVFKADANTVVLNTQKSETKDNLSWIRIEADAGPAGWLNKLYEQDVQSILVEGGAAILNHFIEAGLWDEARVIVNHSLISAIAVAAPVLQDAKLAHTEVLADNSIYYYLPTH